VFVSLAGQIVSSGMICFVMGDGGDGMGVGGKIVKFCDSIVLAG
jgi:hypothetical protein